MMFQDPQKRFGYREVVIEGQTLDLATRWEHGMRRAAEIFTGVSFPLTCREIGKIKREPIESIEKNNS